MADSYDAEHFQFIIDAEHPVLRLLDEEVAQIMQECGKWDVDNRWTGHRDIHGTPKITRMRMAHSVGEHLAGLRNTACGTYNYLQLKLRFNGILPLRRGLQVSHLCHDGACTDVRHLVYESPRDNIARNACIHAGHCSDTKQKPGYDGTYKAVRIPKPACDPACIFGVHGKRKLHDGSIAGRANSRKMRSRSHEDDETETSESTDK